MMADRPNRAGMGCKRSWGSSFNSLAQRAIALWRSEQYLRCGSVLHKRIVVVATTRVSRIRHPPDFSRALRVRVAIIKHRAKQLGAIATRHRDIGNLLL